MHAKKSLITAAILIVLSILICTGCGSFLRNRQLEKIAKDWCLVIRASQVIPVYPLSEDLQPGDLLLVTTPIEQQVTLYDEKGFLPLDQMIGRLFASDFLRTSDRNYANYFKSFYNGRYKTAGNVIPPGDWQQTTSEGKHMWAVAPMAAFPTYKFDVQSGGGLNLAIPIQGVPFALGIMNTDKASGSVTISQASTFGLDNWRLEKMVRDWALEHRKLLRAYEPHDCQQYFLRVVSRVYVTGKLDVNITNQSATGLGGAAGANRSLAFMENDKDTTAATYKQMIGDLNDIANDGKPGARFTITAASSRSVTLKEEFKRPLVVGYVGFDMPILKGGRLGPPISTLEQLTGRSVAPIISTHETSINRAAVFNLLLIHFEDIKNLRATRLKKELDKLGGILSDSYEFSLYKTKSSGEIYIKEGKRFGTKIKPKTFEKLLEYYSDALITIDTLKDHLSPSDNPEYRSNFTAAESSKSYIEYHLQNEPAVRELVEFILFEN